MHRRPQKIFFSGIGGSGMSAIACFMADKGHVVVGSDRSVPTSLKGFPVEGGRCLTKVGELHYAVVQMVRDSKKGGPKK